MKKVTITAIIAVILGMLLYGIAAILLLTRCVETADVMFKRYQRYEE